MVHSVVSCVLTVNRAVSQSGYTGILVLSFKVEFINAVTVLKCVL